MMRKTTTWIVGAMLMTTSVFAVADQLGATTRQERMDAALANYRSVDTSKASSTAKAKPVDGQAADCNAQSTGGSFAKAEAAMSRGTCKTGHAIDKGVKSTGNAIGAAGAKASGALRRTGEKMGGSPEKATNDPVAR